LQHVFESEADGDRRDAETGNKVARFECRKNDDRRDENAENNNQKGSETTEQVGERYVEPRFFSGGVNDALDDTGDNDKHADDDNAENDIRQLSQKTVAHIAQSLPDDSRIEFAWLNRRSRRLQ